MLDTVLMSLWLIILICMIYDISKSMIYFNSCPFKKKYNSYINILDSFKLKTFYDVYELDLLHPKYKEFNIEIFNVNMRRNRDVYFIVMSIELIIMIILIAT